MEKDGLPREQPGQHPLWFNVLLLVDAFALGGLVVWRLVLDLIESTMVRATGSEAIGMFFHLDDRLATYWLSHIGVSLLLVVITATAYVWLRTRSKLVSALTLGIPIGLFVWFWTSRL